MSLSSKSRYSIPRRRYLSEEVTLIIKKRIFDLEFKPGDRLIVETLAQEIDVSITPIREGLKELVSQGLVIYDGKSYSVFNPSKKEILDLMSIRRYLELLSVSLATENLEPTQIDDFFSLFTEYVNSDRISDGKELIEMDQRFHRALLQASHNDRLQSMLEMVQEQIWLVRSWGFSQSYSSDIAKQTIRDHIDILKAIKELDANKAEAIMREHLITAEKRTINNLIAKEN